MVTKLYDGMRVSDLISKVPALVDLQLPELASETFTFDFLLKRVLGGRAVSSSCWIVPPKARERGLFPRLKSFRILNSDYDPLLPRRTGNHGMQISCLLAEVEDELSIRRGQCG